MATYEDPLVGFHFALDFGGQIVGFFTECSGIGSENEVIEHKVVSPDGHEIVMKLAGRLKWENIVLKRGITISMDIWEWRKMVEDGDVEHARRSGSIMMRDSKLEKTVAQWNFYRAWPAKLTGPQPKADSNEVAIEELTITHEYIERVNPSK
jgi:phage tail-like protein